MSTPFGTYLRASRLGYHQVKRLGDAFVRMSDDRLGTFRVEVVPRGGFQYLVKPPSGEFYVWWEENEDLLIDSCKPLADMAYRYAKFGRMVEKPCVFLVNDEGKEDLRTFE